jgi:hypothetical protein
VISRADVSNGREVKCTESFFVGRLERRSRLGLLSRYSDWMRAGRFGDRIPVGAKFSVPLQTGPGSHPAFCKTGARSLFRIKATGA